MALAIPPDWLWPVILGVTVAAAILLSLTPGFRWRSLTRGRGSTGGWSGSSRWRRRWRAGLLVWRLVPGPALALPRRAPGLWLMIMALYPLLSALPQELIFRALFFGRYGALFERAGRGGDQRAGVRAGAPDVLELGGGGALTVAGGAIFARAYLRHGFLQAVLLHAVCGGILFTSGLGTFFYHGAVG